MRTLKVCLCVPVDPLGLMCTLARYICVDKILIHRVGEMSHKVWGASIVRYDKVHFLQIRMHFLQIRKVLLCCFVRFLCRCDLLIRVCEISRDVA